MLIARLLYGRRQPTNQKPPGYDEPASAETLTADVHLFMSAGVTSVPIDTKLQRQEASAGAVSTVSVAESEATSGGGVGMAMMLLASRMVTRLRRHRRRQSESSTTSDGDLELAGPSQSWPPSSGDLSVQTAPAAVPVNVKLKTGEDDEDDSSPLRSQPKVKVAGVSLPDHVRFQEQLENDASPSKAHHREAGSSKRNKAQGVASRQSNHTTGTNKRLELPTASHPHPVMAITHGPPVDSMATQPMIGLYSKAGVSEEWIDGMDADPSLRSARASRTTVTPKGSASSRAPPKAQPKPNIFDDDLETDLMLLG